ncbi:MAG: NAD-dependent epimerase/dehydratase family protein [Gemmatimonadota bacterium]|nr:NAD-dependent epimerase/dehydratase family protein [Gemmatimonadota bacterium]
MKVLVIGGTRNLGHHLVHALVDAGHRVTTFNRGETADELPDEVDRLHGDRADPAHLARGVGERSFDACVDTIALRPGDTRAAIDALDGKVGHYVHISTGQVYLVRAGCPVPAREEDYEGPLKEPPPGDSWEAPEYRYGVEKRACEDVLEEAWATRRFPATRLRPAMIHGPRDHHHRLHGMVHRLLDDDPLVVPLERGPHLRHVHVEDVVDAILVSIEEGVGRGAAYNLAQDDLWSHQELLDRMGEELGVEPDVVRLSREELVEAGVFPGCAPFTNPWMSVLDNGKAKSELGFEPRGFDDYLPELVATFREAPPPEGFAEERERERALVG